MGSDRMQDTYDPRYDGLYQRGGATGAASVSASPAPSAPALPRPAEDSSEPSVIREVGPGAPERRASSTPLRNPFDVWVWVVAAVLVALGVYLLSAPIVHERQYMESMALGQPGGPPWFSYTITAASPLIFLGVATAVVQLFVLSVRHTLRTR